jgi:hypothetical protein
VNIAKWIRDKWTQLTDKDELPRSRGRSGTTIDIKSQKRAKSHRERFVHYYSSQFKGVCGKLSRKEAGNAFDMGAFK